MKPYVKFLMIIVVFALWIMMGQLSSKSASTTSGGCGCGDGGTCSVKPLLTSMHLVDTGVK